MTIHVRPAAVLVIWPTPLGAIETVVPLSVLVHKSSTILPSVPCKTKSKSLKSHTEIRTSCMNPESIRISSVHIRLQPKL